MAKHKLNSTMMLKTERDYQIFHSSYCQVVTFMDKSFGQGYWCGVALMLVVDWFSEEQTNINLLNVAVIATGVLLCWNHFKQRKAAIKLRDCALEKLTG